MKTKSDWLSAIKDAKDAGLDCWAYALIVVHDRLFPEAPLKPLLDRMVLEQVERARQLREIPPTTWSYAKLDGTVRAKPIPYYRREDGAIVRYWPQTGRVSS